MLDLGLERTYLAVGELKETIKDVSSNPKPCKLPKSRHMVSWPCTWRPIVAHRRSLRLRGCENSGVGLRDLKI